VSTSVSGPTRASGLLVGLLVVLGCSAPDEGAERSPAPQPPSSEVLARFADTHDLVGLPHAAVRISAAEDDAPRIVVNVLVAATPDARARGLQGVPELPTGVGMLFVFPDASGSAGRPGFWMLDTLLALDIAFAADGVIVGVATMAPCAAHPCPVTHPGVMYDVAVELEAGVLTGAGVGPGDRLVWSELPRGPQVPAG
jgi:uncharacterized membrane protein (UPF0127 family)